MVHQTSTNERPPSTRNNNIIIIVTQSPGQRLLGVNDESTGILNLQAITMSFVLDNNNQKQQQQLLDPLYAVVAIESVKRGAVELFE